MLLKLLLLPIWLPLKLLWEILEHSGHRHHHGRRRYRLRMSGRGWAIAGIVFAALLVVGAIGGAFSGHFSAREPVSDVSHKPGAIVAAGRSSTAAAHSTVPGSIAHSTVPGSNASQPSARGATAPAMGSQPAAATGPGGCHPLTNAGGCYEPGEFCRTTDHGVTGLAGNGETIKCEDANGWRWEPIAAPPAPGPTRTSRSPSRTPTPPPTTAPPSTSPTPAPTTA